MLSRARPRQNQNALQRIMSGAGGDFRPADPGHHYGRSDFGLPQLHRQPVLVRITARRRLCDISQFWAGVDSFLWLIGEAVFHMLPVGICWSVTKKMGTTQMLGIVLGLTLVSGQLLNAYCRGHHGGGRYPGMGFRLLHRCNMIGYQAQVIPAILAAFTLVYLEKFFRKITPQVVSHDRCAVLQPGAGSDRRPILCWAPSAGRSVPPFPAVVYAGITGSFRVVFGAVFGFVYAPLVITGLHHMSNAIDLQLIADLRRHDAVADDRAVQHCAGHPPSWV